MSNTTDYQGPEFRLMNDLEQWLNSAEVAPSVLVGYLEGRGLPAVGHAYEPHAWLASALRVSGDRPGYERKLAKLLAEFLTVHEPDKTRPGDQPDQVIYNLLHLCADLSYPEVLYEPLCHVWKRQSFRPDEDWLGTTHRRSLLLALIGNQRGQDLRDVWSAMLNESPDSYLGGDWRDGFEGLAAMEIRWDDDGEADLSPAGEALAVAAKKLEHEEMPGIEFRRYIQRAMPPDPCGPDWPMGLITEADRTGWQKWAVRFLPNLCFRPVADVPELVLWTGIYQFLEQHFDRKPKKKWCDGEVVLVRLPYWDPEGLEDLCLWCESLRRQEQFPARTDADRVFAEGARDSGIPILESRSKAVTSVLVD